MHSDNHNNLDKRALQANAEFSLRSCDDHYGNRRVKCSSYGFTLIELLVVVSIIALLVSILLPALGKARENAQSVACMANLKGHGLTVLMFLEDEPYLPYYVRGPYTGTWWWRLYEYAQEGIDLKCAADSNPYNLGTYYDGSNGEPALDIELSYAWNAEFGYYSGGVWGLPRRNLHAARRPGQVPAMSCTRPIYQPGNEMIPYFAPLSWGPDVHGWDTVLEYFRYHSNNTRGNWLMLDGHVEVWPMGKSYSHYNWLAER